MSYRISGSGHAADHEQVREAFRVLVRALDKATKKPEGRFEGDIHGGTWVGDDQEPPDAFTLTADDVREAA